MSVSPPTVGGASASPAFTPPLQSPSVEETTQLFKDLKFVYSLLFKDFYHHDRISEVIHTDLSKIGSMYRDNVKEFKEILSQLKQNKSHLDNLIEIIGDENLQARNAADQESYDAILSLLGMREHFNTLKTEAEAAVTEQPLAKRIQTIARTIFKKGSAELTVMKIFHQATVHTNSDKRAEAINELRGNKEALKAIFTFIRDAGDAFKSDSDIKQIEAALKAIGMQEYIASLDEEESVEE
jgi:hypothetical protein